ncbi:MAG: hypothetical protein JWQ09_2967 [Segetibacter sp.]|nr:hypothetical protein [Segetibacter sp.]
MKTTTISKKNNVKPIAQKNTTGKKQVKKSSVLKKPTTEEEFKAPPGYEHFFGDSKEENTEPRPEVNFISETPMQHGAISSVFLNKINSKQEENVRRIIEKRIEREKIKSEYIVAALAEALEYRVYDAHKAGELFLEFSATLLYNKSFFEPQFSKYGINELIKYLKRISSFLSMFEDKYEGVLFDYWKVTNTTEIHLSSAMDLQYEHAERQVVDDGVWLFDMQFEVPFNELSEEEKVDRVRIFFQKWKDWHGDEDKELIIPGYVSKYIPKAMELIKITEKL